MSPAVANTGARGNGLELPFVRIRGRGGLVTDGASAVMSIIEGDGDGDVCDNGDEEMRIEDIVGDWGEPLDVNEYWREVSKRLSNGHQSKTVGEAPGTFD